MAKVLSPPHRCYDQSWMSRRHTEPRPREVQRVAKIVGILSQEYQGAECSLHHANPFQLLVATILSAQCTDVRVNMVTPHLFEEYPSPEVLALADPAEVQEIIRSTGFFRNKTRSLIGSATRIVSSFEGHVPSTMKDLLTLPGVARKTANVVLGTAFGIASGVVVDTHVGRLTGRLGMTPEKTPVAIERDLMEQIEQKDWIDFSHWLIHHGRQVCHARKPQCGRCVLVDLCPYYAEKLA